MIRLLIVINLLFAVIMAKAGPSIHNHVPEKVIVVTINQKGQALMGRDTLTMGQLVTELQNRLWKSYIGNGQMYDAIRLQYSGDVSPAMQEAAEDAVRRAQQKALTDVCLEKHRKLFIDLDERQQNKIRRQFPVLFQTNFSDHEFGQ